MKQNVTCGVGGKNRELLKHVLSMGIGLSPCTSFYQSLHKISLIASVDLPPSSVLAVIPEKSIWNLSNVYDHDGCGLMPSPKECLLCIPKRKDLLDVFYLALHLSYLTHGKGFSWWNLQARKEPPLPLGEEVEIMASTFLSLLSRKNATPPLHVFLALTALSLQRSILLPQEKDDTGCGRGSRAMIPVVDLIPSEINGNSNVALEKCDAQDARKLLAKNKFYGGAQLLRQRRGKASCWLLKTTPKNPPGFRHLGARDPYAVG